MTFQVVPTVQTTTRSGGPRATKYKALLAAAIALEVGYSIVVSPADLGVECDGSVKAISKVRTNVASAVASHITRKGMGVRIRTSVDTNGNIVLSRFPALDSTAQADAAPDVALDVAPDEDEDEDEDFTL